MNINLMRLKIDYFVYHGTVSIARNDPKKQIGRLDIQKTDKSRTKIGQKWKKSREKPVTSLRLLELKSRNLVYIRSVERY